MTIPGNTFLNAMISDISAYILAGGKSSRFGENKALYNYEGTPLVQRVVRTVHAVIPRIGIIANQPELYSFLDLPVYTDIIPGLGPLGGIYTALRRSSTPYVFIAACDMPDISPDVIRYMISLAENHDVTIPWNDNFYEPLHAIYSRSCLGTIERMIERDERRVSAFLEIEAVSTRKVLFDEISAIADPSSIFRNINFKADLGI